MNKNNIQMHITGITILAMVLIGLGIGLFSIFTGGSTIHPYYREIDKFYNKPHSGQSQSSSDVQCGSDSSIQCAATH
jgi:hypothetical protein